MKQPRTHKRVAGRRLVYVHHVSGSGRTLGMVSDPQGNAIIVHESETPEILIR